MHTTLFNRYQILRKLGKGAQSTVYLVKDLKNQNVLKAAKVLKGEVYKEKCGKELIDEFQILESVDHENLVRVHECRLLPEDKNPVVITEYFENSRNLEDFIKHPDQLNLNEKIQITYQILNALSYLHKKKIIHGDIKPTNILIAKDSRSFPYPIVKLIDFGVSQDLFAGGKRKRVGTPYYIAPEAVTEGVEFASDVYSFGVILYRLFIASELPYKGMKKEDILASHAGHIALFRDSDYRAKDVPPTIFELLQSCLKTDPIERPRKLGQWLRKLHFEFPEAISSLPHSTNGARSRRCLGFNSLLSDMQKHIRHLQEKPMKAKTSGKQKPHAYIICGSSGAGKTRFLQEAGRFCQQQNLQQRLFLFKPFDFWAEVLSTFLEEYPSTQASKKLKGRILKALRDGNEDTLNFLTYRYISALSQELGSLVIMIDGLSSYLPQSFFEPLKALISSTEKRDFKPLFFILSSDLAPNEAEPQEGSVKLEELNETSLKPLAMDFAPSQMKMLARDGLVRMEPLPPWTEKELKTYLHEIFGGNLADISTDENLISRMLSHTKGNPGFIQALCDEGPDLLKENLSTTLSELHDLQIYKLKYYDENKRALLAFVASLDSLSIKHAEEIWTHIRGNEAMGEVRATFIRAFDDGILTLSGRSREHYVIPNINLQSHLRALATDTFGKLGQTLHKILALSDALTKRQTLYLARFLSEPLPWAHALRLLLESESKPHRQLEFSPLLKELREILLQYSHPQISQLDLLWFEWAAAEIANLEYDLETAENIIRPAIRTLENMETENAQGLLAKCSLTLGTTLRAKKEYLEAEQHFQSAIESDLLMDRDHYYALGSLAHCRLSAHRRDEISHKESLEFLNAARKELRPIDSVRYAILTSNLADYFKTKNQGIRKALPLFQKALCILEGTHEYRRIIRLQTEIGQSHYKLGDFLQANHVLTEALGSAERFNLEKDCIKILTLMLQTTFALGDLRKFLHYSSRFMSYCARLGDWQPMTRVIEQMTHAYLEKGLINRAVTLVKEHLEHLDTMKDLSYADKQYHKAIAQLLLGRIDQLKGDWHQAEVHIAKASNILPDLVGKHPNAHAALQVLQIYHADHLAHVDKRETALKELETAFENNIFSGFLEHEALFRALHLSLNVKDEERIRKYLPICKDLLPKIYPDKRIMFYSGLAKYHLDRQEIEEAEWAIKRASKLLNQVTHPVLRAQLFHQHARLLMWQGSVDRAFQKWEQADKALANFTHTWKPEDFTMFKDNTVEWKEHQDLLVHLKNTSHRLHTTH